MSRYKELIESIPEQNTNGGISFEKWTTLLLTDMAISLAVIADALVERDIPSAEPKTPQNGSMTCVKSEKMHVRTTDDCISRKDAIKSMANAIWHYPNELYTGLNSYEMSEALAKDGLMFLPSAEPEIIRCRDCKYSQMTDDGECRFCKIWFAEEEHFLPGDYYCADAERKDNG